MPNMGARAARNLVAVKEKNPLIHNITNFVVMNTTANALLAMGAAPVMAHCEKEVEEMVALAGALVLNIGTLNEDWVAAMIAAGRRANALNTPVVLDPVGVGATAFRTASARKLLDTLDIRVVRGNASEILALRSGSSGARGVDSRHAVEEAVDTAGILARRLGVTLAVTGPVDLVTDGAQTLRVANGCALMARVTGTGCTASAVVGAFLAVDDDPVAATATALAFFGLAGQKAAYKAAAPGSFQVALLDALYSLTPQELEAGAQIAPIET